MARTEIHCESCGTPFPSNSFGYAMVPDAYWKLIAPKPDGTGMLCLSCMEVAFSELGFGTEHPRVPCFIIACDSLMISDRPTFADAGAWMKQPIRLNRISVKAPWPENG